MDKPQPEDQADRVKTALFEGRKIEAIKLYREQTGVGLKEAKDAMDHLEAQLRASSPQSFKHTQAKGCSVGILAVAPLVAYCLYR